MMYFELNLPRAHKFDLYLPRSMGHREATLRRLSRGNIIHGSISPGNIIHVKMITLLWLGWPQLNTVVYDIIISFTIGANINSTHSGGFFIGAHAYDGEHKFSCHASLERVQPHWTLTAIVEVATTD